MEHMRTIYEIYRIINLMATNHFWNAIGKKMIYWNMHLYNLIPYNMPYKFNTIFIHKLPVQ